MSPESSAQQQCRSPAFVGLTPVRVFVLQTDIPLAALQTAIRVAASCVDTDPKRRPRMADVVRTLGAAMEVSAETTAPFFTC